MPTLRNNRSVGSILLQAIDSGTIHKILVRESEVGHFQVDHGAHLFLIPARPSGSGWRAILTPPLLEKLAAVHNQEAAHGQRNLFGGPYLWVVCDDECCVLQPEEWTQVIALGEPLAEQSIWIKRPPNCSFRVRGDAGELPHTIPLKRFPSLAVAA
jgi:hypothetical protein